MDMNYKRVAKNAGFRIDIKRGDDMRSFPLEKARIQVFIIPLYFGIAAILCWGCTCFRSPCPLFLALYRARLTPTSQSGVLERNAPLAAPLVLSFVIGLCLTGSFNGESLSRSRFALLQLLFAGRKTWGGDRPLLGLVA